MLLIGLQWYLIMAWLAGWAFTYVIMGIYLQVNRECGKQLNISWNGVNLTHCNLPVYLGVTLDRTLSYKAHIEKTKKKVGTRNNIIRKLRTSKWEATPTTLRLSALALCYSAAEYACPVWERSTHAKKLNATLNETCRMITGCLKLTNSVITHQDISK